MLCYRFEISRKLMGLQQILKRYLVYVSHFSQWVAMDDWNFWAQTPIQYKSCTVCYWISIDLLLSVLVFTVTIGFEFLWSFLSTRKKEESNLLCSVDLLEISKFVRYYTMRDTYIQYLFKEVANMQQVHKETFFIVPLQGVCFRVPTRFALF